jgi:hypothetical protein
MPASAIATYASAVFLLISIASSASANDWDKAARAIVRLPPEAFPNLPASVTAELRKRGCTVPQPTSFTSTKANVISGSFASPGQIDYAALCSRNGSSHIFVVWGGPTRCPPVLQNADDRSYLQVFDPPKIGYSRFIAPATQRAIAYYRANVGGPKPPDTRHTGIEDIFAEKASAIFYCARGRWKRLQGMD